MSLIDSMMEPFCFVEKTRQGDGESGYETIWTDGVAFDAVATLNTSLEAKQAEQAGVTSLWTITTSKKVLLEFGDIIKRLSDGKVFRVTSDKGDTKSPAVSTLDIAQVSAEKWRIPQ